MYFWTRILSIVKQVTKHKNYRLALNIFITTLPAGVVGYTVASIIVVMFTLFTVGVVMIIIDKLPSTSAIKDGSEMSHKRALFIGLSQMLASIPGVSRS